MSDTGDNVTDDTKREEAQEEEARQKQKEKEEREESDRKQREKDEKERQRKEKEEKDKKEQEEKKNQEEAYQEYDTASEEGKSRQRDFFRAELLRLQRSLRDEASKITKPQQKEYYPYIFTNLEPYTNTAAASYLIQVCDDRGRPRLKSPEDPRQGYVSRNTATGLCDPWDDLRMDREFLPRIPTTPATKTRKRTEKSKGKKDKKGRPPKEGSTRLPKFPVVDYKENASEQFPFGKVPQRRQEMAGLYSQHAPKKVETDYKRTRGDFYRMELDKLDEVHPINRPHVRKAYFAYLQNTPGSKKAIKECVKSLDVQPPAQKAN